MVLLGVAQGGAPPGSGEPVADVQAVEATGSDGAVELRVTIRSPDTGCSQYANWWEVLSEAGDLLYRRVLRHSHVDEQPFTRSGGAIDISVDTVVLVRAHMHPTGYGGKAMKGSVAAGFEAVELPADFAAEAAREEPLPEGCRF